MGCTPKVFKCDPLTLELDFEWHHCHQSDNWRELPGTWKLCLICIYSYIYLIELISKFIFFNLHLFLSWVTLPHPSTLCTSAPFLFHRNRIKCYKSNVSNITYKPYQTNIRTISDKKTNLKISAAPWYDIHISFRIQLHTDHRNRLWTLYCNPYSHSRVVTDEWFGQTCIFFASQHSWVQKALTGPLYWT